MWKDRLLLRSGRRWMDHQSCLHDKPHSDDCNHMRSDKAKLESCGTNADDIFFYHVASFEYNKSMLVYLFLVSL